jgi:predicted dehydrogenase
VVLALPTGVRTPIVYKALERGKHVLIEKPIATCAAEVEKMIALQKDRVAGCCSSRNVFTGHAEAATRCVESGALGQIRMVRFRAIGAAPAKPSDNPPPWRQSMKANGGGILVNWSCYDLNYVMHIAGWQAKPKSVLAKWWPVGPKMTKYVAAGSDADSHYVALIQCEDDMVLSMERAEFASAVNDQAWEIVGTDATLHLQLVPQPGKPNAITLDRFVPGQGVVSETIWEEKQGYAGGSNVIRDFAGAIRDGRQPATDLKRALLMQKITDAIYASAARGTCVPV